MTPGQQLQHWRTSALAFWQDRAPRERRALAMLGGVMLVALTLQLVWSVESGRRAAQQRVPRLAADAGRMAALGTEWQRLAPDLEAAAGKSPEAARQDIARRLPELGGKLAAQWTADGELALKGEADFAVWTRWTAAMQQENRLVLRRCRVVGKAGGVAIDASYALAGPAL